MIFLIAGRTFRSARFPVPPPLKIKDLSTIKMDGTLETTISGWGYTSSHFAEPVELQSLTLPVRRTSELGEETPEFIKNYDLDAPGLLSVIKKGVTTCNGDSGTGWTAKIDGENYLIGIHSAGNWCESIGVGVEITQLLPFVTELTGLTAAP